MYVHLHLHRSPLSLACRLTLPIAFETSSSFSFSSASYAGPFTLFAVMASSDRWLSPSKVSTNPPIDYS